MQARVFSTALGAPRDSKSTVRHKRQIHTRGVQRNIGIRSSGHDKLQTRDWGDSYGYTVLAAPWVRVWTGTTSRSIEQTNHHRYVWIGERACTERDSWNSSIRLAVKKRKSVLSFGAHGTSKYVSKRSSIAVPRPRTAGGPTPTCSCGKAISFLAVHPRRQSRPLPRRHCNRIINIKSGHDDFRAIHTRGSEEKGEKKSKICVRVREKK